jgi:hypothetical protein
MTSERGPVIQGQCTPPASAMFNVGDVLRVRNGSLRGFALAWWDAGSHLCLPPATISWEERKKVTVDITACVEAYKHTLISNHLSTAEPPFFHQGRRIWTLLPPQLKAHSDYTIPTIQHNSNIPRIIYTNRTKYPRPRSIVFASYS